ncbi:MAG: hypothetical protein E7602_00655 [Ruminococcaceae bacterium]|nr:hypothetical protein [Oscillospiraceae bacterium]
MQKKSLDKIVSKVFDVPLDGISNIPCADFIGNTILNIDGCTGIKKYETNEIIIRSKAFLISILGDELTMITFSEGRVSIRGIIKTYSMEEI